MSNDAELDVPTIIGTRGESLSWKLSTSHSEYTDLHVAIEFLDSLPPFRQTVSTATYALPDVHQLGALLDGNSNIAFNFSTLHFECTIYEHTWGARYGLITTGAISTLQERAFSPWPKPTQLGNYLLDRHSSAACLHFAFRCEYDSLRQFYEQLSKTAARLATRNAT